MCPCYFEQKPVVDVQVKKKEHWWHHVASYTKEREDFFLMSGIAIFNLHIPYIVMSYDF